MSQHKFIKGLASSHKVEVKDGQRNNLLDFITSIPAFNPTEAGLMDQATALTQVLLDETFNYCESILGEHKKASAREEAQKLIRVLNKQSWLASADTKEHAVSAFQSIIKRAVEAE